MFSLFCSFTGEEERRGKLHPRYKNDLTKERQTKREGARARRTIKETSLSRKRSSFFVVITIKAYLSLRCTAKAMILIIRFSKCLQNLLMSNMKSFLCIYKALKLAVRAVTNKATIYNVNKIGL